MVIYRVSSQRHYLARIRFSTTECDLPKRATLNPMTKQCSQGHGFAFHNVDLTFRNHYVTRVHFSGQPVTFRLTDIRSCTADCGSPRRAMLNPTHKNTPTEKKLTRTWKYFNDANLMSLSHYLTSGNSPGQP